MRSHRFPDVHDRGAVGDKTRATGRPTESNDKVITNSPTTHFLVVNFLFELWEKNYEKNIDIIGRYRGITNHRNG